MFHSICDKTLCTGCGACSNICPEGAITMNMDKRGFLYPEISQSSCIECNRCKRVCPVLTPPVTYNQNRAFAFQNSDEIRFKSTSGGFFHEIAVEIINEGGVVCGAAFNSDMMLQHIIIERLEDIFRLQRSKYVQSFPNNLYAKIKNHLKDNRKVLFVGLGCQAAALRNYVGEDDNLVIADLVCHGISSSGFFQDWIKYIEDKYGKVEDVLFRDKTYGYATPNVRVMFENGKYLESCRDSTLYTKLFFENLIIRDCCFNCQFKTIDRASDITLGDLWTIEKYDQSKDDNKGTTAIFSHTIKGESICRKVCSLEIEVSKLISTDSKKMVEKVHCPITRTEFWERYSKCGFEKIVDQYIPDNMKIKAKFILKKVMNYTGISGAWYKKKKNKSF